MKTCFHGRMDFAKTLKLRIRACYLDPRERGKRSASSREEEGDTQMCPCGKAIKSRTHTVGKCEMYKEERYVLEEMMEIYECDTEDFDTLDSSEKTIAILEDRWWPQAEKQEGDTIITGGHS